MAIVSDEEDVDLRNPLSLLPTFDAHVKHNAGSQQTRNQERMK